MILICGHGGRDLRCGVLGPLLRDEFRRVLSRHDGISLADTHPSDPARTTTPEDTRLQRASDVAAAGGTHFTARVGLISHIGGHKFAGNVIVYVPPHATVADEVFGARRRHPLAGCGVWYGRVEPSHVEGIVRETVVNGNVILEHFRGGLDAERKIMRI
ncbi:hypothetical protein jhhlp_008659 [Lomentospora prolificans]|uniref:Altered inheritance of mitochondria protein 32 n=1 Tax=Lomentospora prolificans TaxID=41688 RepID=A0A2N3MYN0_9PEZI|nr:hypothetical protein jhhlp_008659 [Lomentospora prolificans]